MTANSPNDPRLRQLLADLVGFRTVSGERRETARLLAYAKKIAQNHGLHASEFTSRGFKTLILKTQRTKRPKLTLCAHVDVVPGDDDQFRLTVKGDELFGRGVYDMKFAVACFLRLLEELAGELANHDLAVVLTSDEEVGSEDGAKLLIEKGYDTEVCVLPDGGDNMHMERRAKGSCKFKFSATGVPGHASRPWQAENAGQKIVNAVYEIQKLNTNRLDGTTVALTQLSVDSAANQIAGFAWATVDTRFMELDDYQALRHQIERIADRHSCQLETMTLMKPVFVDLESVAVHRFMDCIRSVTGSPSLPPVLSAGASDARFFAEKGVPVIVMQPVGGNHHAQNEWISEKSLNMYYNILKLYVRRMARQ